MLNYILPPIIIVVSVSVLIMFLFRKADQIPAQDFLFDEKTKGDGKKAGKIISLAGELGLKLLERMMHRTKLWSLKFHNISNAWFQTIREKRQRSVRRQQEILEQNIQKENDAKIAESQKTEQAKSEVDSVERKELRPMVSAGATMPQQSRMKEKNKLEEALIKRIAVNPRDIEAYERLGDYYLESENFQDSLECFKQVLRLSPAHHKARLRIRRLEKIR